MGRVQRWRRDWPSRLAGHLALLSAGRGRPPRLQPFPASGHAPRPDRV